MTARALSVEEAYRRLGLPAGAGLAAAKSAFRARVKHLHPDIADATPDNLSDLAAIVAAIRVIESGEALQLNLEVSAAEAESGVTRTLRARGKPVLVRVPAGARQGDQLAPIGETGVTVTLLVRADHAETQARRDEDERLDDFIEEFSRPSAASRFARWNRRPSSSGSTAA